MKWRNDNLISHLMNSFCISQRKASCSQLWLRDHPRQNLCRWSGCWEKGKRNLCKLYASLETHPLLWINQPNHRDDSLNYQDHDSPKQHILSYGQLVRLHNNIYHAKSTYHPSQQLYMLANVYLRISRLPTVAHFRAAKNIIYIYISYIYIYICISILYLPVQPRSEYVQELLAKKKYLPQCQCAMDHGSNSSNRHNTMLMDRLHKPRIQELLSLWMQNTWRFKKDFEVARFDAFGTWWLILMRKQTEF